MQDADTLHVVPNRRGGWEVLREDRGSVLSEHSTLTEAERVALALAADRHAEAVVVHDCYARTRNLPMPV